MAQDRPVLDFVEAVHVVVPFRRPFESAHGVFAARTSWIVLVGDRDGRQGFGEIALDPGASKAELAAVGHATREAVDLLTDGLTPDWSARSGSGPIGRAVRAGVDSALEWLAADGRTADGSGGRPQAVSVAVNATLEHSAPAEAAEAAARAVSAGFSTLKVKVVGSESVEVLIERVAAVRDAVGGSVRLRLDANGSWDFDMALARLAALATFRIEYVEQPLAAADLEGHSALRRMRGVPIALDESVTDERAAGRVLEAGAADVLVVKPARVGGPGVVRAIEALASEAGVPVVLSTFFETGVGTVAAVRAAAELQPGGDEPAHGLATTGLLEHDLLSTPLAVVAGRISLPTALAVDLEALEHYSTERIGQRP